MTEQEIQQEVDTLVHRYALRRDERNTMTNCFKGQVLNAQVRDSKRLRIVRTVQAFNLQRQRSKLSAIPTSLTEDALELLYRMYPTFTKPVAPPKPKQPHTPKPRQRKRARFAIWHEHEGEWCIVVKGEFAPGDAVKVRRQDGYIKSVRLGEKVRDGLFRVAADLQEPQSAGLHPRTDTQDVIVI